MKQRGMGFQKPLSAPKMGTGRLGIVHYDGDRVTCNCGWGTQHSREKVREDRIDKHFNKVHGGLGMRI